MNTERDKFLTEAMGECWHDWRDVDQNLNEVGYPSHLEMCFRCKKTWGSYAGIPPSGRIDFSTWEGFGKLWTWAINQVWLNQFFGQFVSWEYLIHPDRFANAVHEFLRARS